MSKKENYTIQLNTLAEGQHTFTHSLGEDFLLAYPNELIEGLSCNVSVLCDKTETLVTCTFDISGNLVLLCDRTLEIFDFPVHIKELMYYKFGEQYEELSENLIVLPEKTAEIDLAQPIYDFLSLSVPSRKLHPSQRDDQYEEEQPFFFSTAAREENPQAEQPSSTDPRWAKLNTLKKS